MNTVAPYTNCIYHDSRSAIHLTEDDVIDINGTLGLHPSLGPVNGGFYGEYPSLEPRDQVEGDMAYNNDFRGLYGTLLDRWMGIDPQPVLGGAYEQFDMIRS